MKLTFPILLVLVLLIPLCKTDATTFTITSTADSGPGTLRDALASASDGDTINATRIHGVIQLTSGELLVNKNVVILGPGPAKLAVDGDELSRVFHFRTGVVGDLSGLTITNGVAPYNFGGGIYNDHAELIVSNCVITGNFGGQGAGIANDGSSGRATLAVVNSLITGNWDPEATTSGGGIYNNGQNGNATVTLVHCTVSDNITGDLGGGIINDAFDGSAVVTVVNSTVSGNVAGSSGGGICNAGWSGTASVTLNQSTVSSNQAGYGVSGSGGGVYNEGDRGTASLTVTDCAIIGNHSGSGGGLFNIVSGTSGTAVLTLANTTISGNLAGTGGGIYNSDQLTSIGAGYASLQILNSTLSDNSAETIYDTKCGNSTVEIGSTILNAGVSGSTIGFGCSFTANSVTSLGYNLSSDDADGVLANATDLINTDPLLGRLQDNGGPTFTCALLPGSPAIDQGRNFSGELYDQRGPGFARTFDDPFIPNVPGGDGTDIGAFEVQPSSANPAQVVQHLLDMVNSQAKRPQPLDATLKAALASIGRNNSTAAINQLTAFQNQVRAQIMRFDPALAAALLQAAQDAINGLNAAQH